MPHPARFDEVFARLRETLLAQSDGLLVTADNSEWVNVDSAKPYPGKGPIQFGAVRKGRRYVSYYLMPVYIDPGLLDGASPNLRKRMQGKSCFNFTSVDDALFKELAALTARGADVYRRGWGA